MPWQAVVTELRQDLYGLDDRLYESIDMYCPVPDCDCGKVLLSFETLVPPGGASVGGAWVHKSGKVELEPHKKHGDRLEQLWSAFQRRHPRFLERCAQRDACIKALQWQAPKSAPPAAGG